MLYQSSIRTCKVGNPYSLLVDFSLPSLLDKSGFLRQYRQRYSRCSPVKLWQSFSKFLSSSQHAKGGKLWSHYLFRGECLTQNPAIYSCHVTCCDPSAKQAMSMRQNQGHLLQEWQRAEAFHHQVQCMEAYSETLEAWSLSLSASGTWCN